MVTTFELPGCHDMWTVISSEVKEDKKVPQRHPNFVQYLLAFQWHLFLTLVMMLPFPGGKEQRVRGGDRDG